MSRRGVIAAALLLAAATAALFWPAARFDFLTIDDDVYVTGNPAVQAGLSRQGIEAAFTDPPSRQWVPFTTLSLAADAELFGPGPGGFHLTNVLLHSLNSGLLFLLLWSATRAPWRSLLAAALFAFHPLRVEPVAWISARKDLLSFLFMLPALWSWVHFARGGRWRWYAASAAFFLLGLMAKPSLIVFPALLLCLDLWPLARLTSHRDLLRRVGEKLPFVALSLTAAIITAARHSGGTHTEIPFISRLGHALTAPLIYLGETLVPAGLGMRTLERSWSAAEGYGLVAGAGLVFLTWGAWRRVSASPWLAAGWMWFLAGLAPVAGLFPAGAFWTADRYTYLVHPGLAVFFVWGGYELIAAGRARWRTAVAIGLSLALLAGCALLTRRLLPSWRDPVTLADRALALSPGDAFHLNARGAFLMMKGDLEMAAADFRAAVASAPGFEESQYNLGLSLVGLGRREEALPYLREAVRLDPSTPLYRRDLARLLFETGREAEAEELMRSP